MYKFFIRKIFTPNVQVMMGPAIIIIVIVFLFIIVIQNGYSRISSQLTDYKSAKKQEDLLASKYAILKELSPGLLEDSSLVILALPEKNPGAYMISQAKNFATNNAIQLTKIQLKDAATLDNNITKMQIIGNIESPDYLSVVKYLKSFSQASPISSIDKLNMEYSSTGILKGEFKISFYWASLPTELPPITQAINQLSSDEETLLSKVGSLTKPEFSIQTPSSPSERLNPFN